LAPYMTFASFHALYPSRKNSVHSNAAGAKKIAGIKGDRVVEPQARKIVE
jgi:hypothetical protein